MIPEPGSRRLGIWRSLKTAWAALSALATVIVWVTVGAIGVNTLTGRANKPTEMSESPPESSAPNTPPEQSADSLLATTGPVSPTPQPTQGSPTDDATSLLAEVNRQIQRLAWANAAFHVPTKMLRGEVSPVVLQLSHEKSLEDLRQGLASLGKSEAARVHVSSRMEARLTGKKFRIQANQPEVQALGTEGIAAWSWDVEAVGTGEQALHLTLSALIDVDGNETHTVVRTFDRVVLVKVTAEQSIRAFVTSSWQWLWAAILVPLWLWAWRRWKGARQAPKLIG